VGCIADPARLSLPIVVVDTDCRTLSKDAGDTSHSARSGGGDHWMDINHALDSKKHRGMYKHLQKETRWSDDLGTSEMSANCGEASSSLWTSLKRSRFVLVSILAIIVNVFQNRPRCR